MENFDFANDSWGMSGRSPPAKNKKEVILIRRTKSSDREKAAPSTFSSSSKIPASFIGDSLEGLQTPSIRNVRREVFRLKQDFLSDISKVFSSLELRKR
ncbi:TPA: hypothetical protein HA351_04465 [Methanosarcinaceae archaeon]|nr:hypothetical protein [Methanosarcinaceae archaeon]